MDDAKLFPLPEPPCVENGEKKGEATVEVSAAALAAINKTIEQGFAKLETALMKVCEKMDMNHARDRYENSKKEVSITTEIRELQQQVQQLLSHQPKSSYRPAAPPPPPIDQHRINSGVPSGISSGIGPRPSVPIRNPFFNNDNSSGPSIIVNRRNDERHNSLSSVEEQTHFAPPASPIATPHPPTSLGGPSLTSKPSLFNRRPNTSVPIDDGFQTNRTKYNSDQPKPNGTNGHITGTNGIGGTNGVNGSNNNLTNLPSSPLPPDQAVPPRKGQLFGDRGHTVEPVLRIDKRNDALQALEAEKARLSQERERKERFEAKTKELLNSLISPKEQSKLFDDESQEGGGLFD